MLVFVGTHEIHDLCPRPGDTSEALRRQRARLRTEAVELGKTSGEPRGWNEEGVPNIQMQQIEETSPFWHHFLVLNTIYGWVFAIVLNNMVSYKLRYYMNLYICMQ